MKIRRLLSCVILLLPLLAHGDYSLAPEALDSGGLRSTSASYTAHFSAMPGGASASADYTLRTGFAGQLSDAIATAIEISATPLTVNEGGSRQLSATLIFDDLTTTPLTATSITWSVQSGPITGINASGLATAAVVYADTPAVVQGVYQTFTDTLGLTILNTDPDNFGTYAADGLPDDWQVQYFGLNNPNAASTQDPDHDGQDNLFEFVAGVLPADPSSLFRLQIAAVPGQPAQKNLIFSPRFPDRVYTPITSTSLGATSVWTDLTTFTSSDNAQQRTLTDTSATGLRKFYRVRITKP